jgi:hypothetical protein
MKEPFNLEQFKQGRKAITRDGRTAEFLYYDESMNPDVQLGANVHGQLFTFFSNGHISLSQETDDLGDLLTHMAPAEHGIKGMPWDLPTPPAPPEGHKWKYMGKAKKFSRIATVGRMFVDGEGFRDEEWSREETWELECNRPIHGIKAVPIEPKEFPAPPEGKAWHNPEKLTPEQVGVSEGWRLLLKNELVEIGDMHSMKNGTWSHSGNHRSSDARGKTASCLTYRTKRPLPATPKLVPLEADDIPPVCWLRTSPEWHSPDRANHLVVVVTVSEIIMAHGGLELMKVSYGTLKDGWEYSTDRKNWKPCSKEAK